MEHVSHRSSDLERQLAGLRYGDHLCMVYENRSEQMAAAALYIQYGLAAGDQCVYAADDQTVNEVFVKLSEKGIDVDREQRRGALRLLTKYDAYLRTGQFDPQEMIDFFRHTTDQAIADGFAGFRITGEMTWALGSERGCDRVIDCEALVNDFFPNHRALALCQYSRQRFGPETIFDVLRTHPLVVVGDQVCSNLYYEPPELVLSGSGSSQQVSQRVDWMIAQLKRSEREVADRRRAEERLREADGRKDEFLAMLAHELRNPLAPIRTGLEVIRLAGDDGVLREQTRCTMERQAQQLARLVDDLLDVSRITSGRIELRTCRVELAHVVQNAVESSRPIVMERGHELTLDLPQQPILLDADPTRLTQVIGNLLHNAAKYTPEQGRIWLSVECEAAAAVLRVRDSGIGIPDDMLHRVFDVFTQVDRSLERTDGGLGIGLTLVKRLVELHGGTVWCQSQGEGQGSEFVVRLPLPAPVQAEMPAPGEAPRVASQRRILVVDDNKDAATMLGMMLKALGNEVFTAYDGLEAVVAAETLRPDVVLMDIGMPRLNGYDAARRIRQEPWGQEMMIIALTGWGQEQDRKQSREAGFDHHLVKPAEPKVVLELIAETKPRPVAQRSASLDSSPESRRADSPSGG